MLPRRFLPLSLTAILALTGSAAAKGPAYWENGTFARPQPPPGGLVVMDSGARYGIWKVVGAAGTVSWIKTDYVHRGFHFAAPHQSTAWVNLAGTSQTVTGISHSPVPTTVGAQYTLTFMVGNLVDPAGIYGTSSTVKVYQNSQFLGTATNADGAGTTTENWQKFTMTFSAKQPWTTIAFINGDPPGDGNCGIGDIDFEPAAPAEHAP
jgi:hypothetical protein